ncbi:Uma2 family endonuclease [Caulobacter sp. ErkDOM-E]|uniref:Uma2 family endonuclease n=1 Tax=Caulobacter sp. ErkDOM-E TaxID=3402778 RepID=UPI003AF7A7D3
MTTSEPSFAERGGSEFLFDFDTFERMDQAGVLRLASGHVELIEGKILQMAPISADHGDVSTNAAVSLTNRLTASGLGRDVYRVLVHVTLKIGEHSAPEPDVLVARPLDGRKYCETADAALVVEVSISTRDGDLNIKAPLYARAGVQELWLVEPESRKVSVLREPRPDGTWASTTILEGDATVSPLFAPQISIPLSELF